MTLGRLLKRYREQRGLTQKKLAADAKMRPDEISRLERGRKKAKSQDTSFEKVKRLARVLKITPNDLAGKEFSRDPRETPYGHVLWRTWCP